MFFGLVSRSFCIDFFSESEFQCLGLPNPGFRMEGIAKIDLSWKSSLMNFGMDFYRFLEALGTVDWWLLAGCLEAGDLVPRLSHARRLEGVGGFPQSASGIYF